MIVDKFHCTAIVECAYTAHWVAPQLYVYIQMCSEVANSTIVHTCYCVTNNNAQYLNSLALSRSFLSSSLPLQAWPGHCWGCDSADKASWHSDSCECSPVGGWRDREVLEQDTAHCHRRTRFCTHMHTGARAHTRGCYSNVYIFGDIDVIEVQAMAAKLVWLNWTVLIARGLNCRTFQPWRSSMKVFNQLHNFFLGL